MWIVWLALVVVQLGFGAYGVIVSKFATENQADPLIFSLIRDAGCFPVLLLAAFAVAETLITLLDQTVTGIWSVVKRFEAILADSLDWHTRELEKQASVPMIERPLCS